MDAQERSALLARKFAAIFDRPPTVWVQAPGRVDLMGSHTDYNMGFVLTQTIDRNTWIAARPRDDEKVMVCSLNVDGCGRFDLDQIEYDTAVPWSNYVRGVAAVLQEAGYTLRGFDGLVHSTVPLSSGLSSSAALEVATAVLFDALGELQLDPLQVALLCQRAENEFVGLNCGILDQYTSVMGQAGQALLLDCRAISSRTVPVASTIQVVICDTRAKRELTGSEYAQRRAQCEAGARILAQFDPEIHALRDVSLEQLAQHEVHLPPVVARRCRFVIEENRRVFDMADALAEGNLAQVDALTAASYVGARDLYEISSPEMERMMEAMRSGPGVIGARQAGAGFGGCMVAFVRAGRVSRFMQHVRDRYRADAGIEPDVYPVTAAPGAGRF